MERVHADEDAGNLRAFIVQPTHEAIDQLIERHIAQARVGEPGHQAGNRHAVGGTMVPFGSDAQWS